MLQVVPINKNSWNCRIYLSNEVFDVKGHFTMLICTRLGYRPQKLIHHESQLLPIPQSTDLVACNINMTDGQL